ncbi:MAG TPA: glycosyltransferase family 4 protein [Candidatus Acidoferrum sp.]|nr:glycosyltransferase family 4 protein [Candidatus Acidoferrum sp.]
MPANNRILMLLENQTYPRDFRVRRESTALTAAGYRVWVICPAGPGQLSRETLNGVQVYRYAPPPEAHGFMGYLWEYGYAMAATFVLSLLIFCREGFDVVHAHNPPDTFVFIAAFYKLLGKGFVFDHHDLSPEMYQARFPAGGSRLVHSTLVLLEKFTCHLADRIIATNESYKKIEMERDRVPESRITIVRNGIELQALPTSEPDRTLCPPGKTIIGYIGVMGFQDGVDYLLRALGYLVYDLKRTDFFCVLVGGGDAFPFLKSLAEQLGISEQILFTGMVDHSEVSRYLGAADICVAPEPSAPYNDRSTAVKLMEYMSLAKPIVAFDLTEHRFTAQGATVFVKPNDELEFARAIAGLMDDPARRKKLGLLGRQRMETALAWQYSIPKLLQVYRAVLPAPAGSPEPSRRKSAMEIQSGRLPHAPPESFQAGEPK